MPLKISFLLAMLLIFMVPQIIARIGNIGAMQPMVVIQTLAGILLGPSVLGAGFPEVHKAIFTPDVVTSLNAIAWWAVMLFAWLTGLELDWRQLWSQRRDTVVTAGLAFTVPMFLGVLATTVLLQFVDWSGRNGTFWQVSLGCGLACAVTALPVLAALIEELGWTTTPMGERLIRYASADDILIWVGLALLQFRPETGLSQIGFLLIFVPAGVGMRLLMPRIGERDRLPLAIVWLILVALGADWAGLHFIIGAFLAGVALDVEQLGKDRMRNIRALSLSMLMPIYFISTGLRTEVGTAGAAVLLGTVLFLLASIGGKLLGVQLAGRALGWTRRDASIIGWLLQSKGLMMIVFAEVLLDRQIITGAAFTSLVLMATASTALAYPLVRQKLAPNRWPALRRSDSHPAAPAAP